MEKIESRALKVGVLVDLVMSIAGWVTYSFIAALSLVAAVGIITDRIQKHTRLYYLKTPF